MTTITPERTPPPNGWQVLMWRATNHVDVVCSLYRDGAVVDMIANQFDLEIFDRWTDGEQVNERMKRAVGLTEEDVLFLWLTS